VQGVDGLGMREGAGRKPRLTEQERSKILGLVKQPPPGRLERYAETLEARDEEGSAPGWSSNGHRMKAPLEYSRGDDEVWISGALRVRDMSSFLKAPVG
jgi:hypothetical protein